LKNYLFIVSFLSLNNIIAKYIKMTEAIQIGQFLAPL